MIVETPTFGHARLASFDPVRFTDCTADGWPIGASATTKFEIVSDRGVTETSTSAWSPDGATFTVTHRKRRAPASTG